MLILSDIGLLRLMYFGKVIEEWSKCRLWWHEVMPAYVIYAVNVVKIIKGGKDNVSDDLSWVEIEFFACGGVS